MKKVMILWLFAGICNLSLLKAQSDTDAEYEAFIRQRVNEMLEFRNERDKEFASFLKEYWEGYTAFAGIDAPMPGPDKPIIYTPPVVVPEEPPVPEKPNIPAEPDPRPKPKLAPDPVVLKPKPKPVPPVNKQSECYITFYGNEYAVSKPETSVYLSAIDENNISNVWTTLSKSNYTSVIEDCLRLKKEIRLNDWGYFMLARSMGEVWSKRKTTDEIAFAQAFILLQSDYKVKMARVNNKLALLIAANQDIYGIPFITISGTRYYIITGKRNESVGTIYTYPKDFANASKQIDTNMPIVPLLKENMHKKVLSSPDHSFELTAYVNKNLIDFYDSYPQSDVAVYMNTEPDENFSKDILSQFKTFIDGKDPLKATSDLLNLIQVVFPYATDGEQFGYEKPFFVDECFYYPYNDCEDRAVLFGYLVRNLLKMDVILLQYPEHIAAAVLFPEETKGDHVYYNNKKYIICDPTYINAPPGECMPQFKSVNPKILTYVRQ